MRGDFLSAWRMAHAAHNGAVVLVGDTSRLLPILRDQAGLWRIAFRPYNASSFQVVALEGTSNG